MTTNPMQEHFVEREKMPVSPLLRELRGGIYSTQNRAILKDKKLVRWVDQEGPGALRRYLRRFPEASLRAAVAAFPVLVRKNHRQDYLARPTQPEFTQLAAVLHRGAPPRQSPGGFFVAVLSLATLFTLVPGRRTAWLL